MTWWVELRATTKRLAPLRFVPLEDLPRYHGTGRFFSVFAIDDETKDAALAARNTRHPPGTVVHANQIYVDFDNNDAAAWAASARLVEQGIAHDVYNSGNRSIHLHVALVPITGSWVPRAVKLWAVANAPNCDTSIYHQSAIFRLPRVFHEKAPGNRKQLVARYEGAAVTLKTSTNTVSLSPRFAADEGDAYHKFFAGLTQTISEGGRRPYVFRNALLGAEAGLTEAEVLDHMLFWNSNFCIPSHEPRAVAEQVSNAFKYLLRKSSNA